MAGMMDTPQTAAQPQEQDPGEELFVRLTAGLRKHIFTKGEQGIVARMQDADDKGRVMGEIVFALVREAAKQAESAGQPADYDTLIAVATEVIDDLTELLSAHGMEITDKDREFALLYAQQLYVETGEHSPEEKQAAQQQLAEFKQGGQFDQTVSYVQQRGMEAGADPFGVEQMDQQPQMMGK